MIEAGERGLARRGAGLLGGSVMIQITAEMRIKRRSPVQERESVSASALWEVGPPGPTAPT